MEQFKQLRKALEEELRGNILPYWMKFTPDPEYGGFYGHVDHWNKPVEKASKGAIMNARILWTFSAAFRMFKENAYLDAAHRAYNFILDHFLDTELGGVYWELDYQANVISSRKQIYAIAFTIYAMAEYRMACGDELALEVSVKLFEVIESHAFDNEKNGYTEAFARDWTRIKDLRLSEKDDNESKTMNTHLHVMEAYANLNRIWKNTRLEKSLENMIHLFLTKFVNKETSHLNLFFDDEWNLKSSLVSYGHDIECSWLLHESAEVLGKPALAEQTGKLAIRMARENFTGLDTDGGLFYEFIPKENKLDSDKHWWPQAEALVGYFNAYQLSGDEEFARKTLQSWDFINHRIIDHQNGEWYWSVNRRGIPRIKNEKAGFWKCPYHNGRACMEMIRRMDRT